VEFKSIHPGTNYFATVTIKGMSFEAQDFVLLGE